MKKQFVTYEIALTLKELGLNDPCLAYFYLDEHHDLMSNCENVIEGDFVVEEITKYLKAPLWQQVIDWFRDKYGLHIEIQSPDFKHEYQFNWTIHKIQQFGGFANGSSNNFYECREQAILKCIELVKNK